MNKEIKSFLASLVFFTRLPSLLPADAFEAGMYNRSAKYFPLVGLIIGLASALTFWLAIKFLPEHVSIILSMIVPIMLTGAMHEDAFADVCDAFGGGWNKEKIFAIMKDSRVGSFGVVGVVMILLFKFALLSEISNRMLPATIVAAHGLSRWAAIISMARYDYVSPKETSKSGDICQRLSTTELGIALGFALIPIFFMGNWMYFLLVIPVFIIQWLLSAYYAKWIDGYTGDCLGSIQQVTEVSVYLMVIIMHINLI
jgi:adenosylcobinamide-GDP ribazoletransferase